MISIDRHSTVNLKPVPILKKFTVFHETPNFVRFEKSYYLTRILRQIFHNLSMKKFHGQNIGHFHSHRTLAAFDTRNWMKSEIRNLFEDSVEVSHI